MLAHLVPDFKSLFLCPVSFFFQGWSLSTQNPSRHASLLTPFPVKILVLSLDFPLCEWATINHCRLEALPGLLAAHFFLPSAVLNQWCPDHNRRKRRNAPWIFARGRKGVPHGNAKLQNCILIHLQILFFFLSFSPFSFHGLSITVKICLQDCTSQPLPCFPDPPFGITAARMVQSWRKHQHLEVGCGTPCRRLALAGLELSCSCGWQEHPQ